MLWATGMVVRSVRQRCTTGDDTAPQPREPNAYGATHAASRQALSQQACEQSSCVIWEQIRRQAVNNLASTIVAERMLCAVMNVTILLVFAGLVVRTDLSDDHDCVFTSAYGWRLWLTCLMDLAGQHDRETTTQSCAGNAVTAARGDQGAVRCGARGVPTVCGHGAACGSA